MGWETTRFIRVYPRDNLEYFDIHTFCNHIAKTARGLSSHVLWYKNQLESCFDLKFECSKSSGALLFDANEADVWELKSFDSGGTNIGYHNEESLPGRATLFFGAHFSFDRIQFYGTKNAIHEVFELIGWEREKDQIAIHSKGTYTGGNHYQTIPVGKYPGERVANIERAEMIALKGEDCWIESIEIPGYSKNNFDDFLLFLNGDVYENYFIGLDKIELYFKDRCVKQVAWKATDGYTSGRWYHRSADWWDNCCNANWLNFHRIRNKATGNDL